MSNNQFPFVEIFILLTGFLVFGMPQLLFAEDFFLGLSTEADFSIDTNSYENTSILDTLSIRQIEEIVTLELIPKIFFRERLGFGYYPKKSLVFFLGLEIPIFEKLSIYKTRSLGVYSLSDFRFDISSIKQTTFETSMNILIPITSIGGVLTGVGIDTNKTCYLKLAYFTGGYLTRL